MTNDKYEDVAETARRLLKERRISSAVILRRPSDEGTLSAPHLDVIHDLAHHCRCDHVTAAAAMSAPTGTPGAIVCKVAAVATTYVAGWGVNGEPAANVAMDAVVGALLADHHQLDGQRLAQWDLANAHFVWMATRAGLRAITKIEEHFWGPRKRKFHPLDSEERWPLIRGRVIAIADHLDRGCPCKRFEPPARAEVVHSPSRCRESSHTVARLAPGNEQRSPSLFSWALSWWHGPYRRKARPSDPSVLAPAGICAGLLLKTVLSDAALVQPNLIDEPHCDEICMICGKSVLKGATATKRNDRCASCSPVYWLDKLGQPLLVGITEELRGTFEVDYADRADVREDIDQDRNRRANAFEPWIVPVPPMYFRKGPTTPKEIATEPREGFAPLSRAWVRTPLGAAHANLLAMANASAQLRPIAAPESGAEISASTRAALSSLVHDPAATADDIVAVLRSGTTPNDIIDLGLAPAEIADLLKMFGETP